MLEFPEHDLVVSEEDRGLKIEQFGRAYLAKNWRLSQETREVFDLAFSYGLNCLIRKGHPSESKLYDTGATVDYIGFSLTPEHYWVFVLDMDSCSGSGPRELPRKTKFRKIYRHILRQNHIQCEPEWRTPQNLHIDIVDLSRGLQCIAPHMDKLGKMQGARLRRGAFDFFVDEEDLHSFLISNWSKCPLSKSLRIIESKRILNNIAHRDGEIDLLAEDQDGNLFVIELKDSARNTSGETPVQQLHRYLEHPDIIQMTETRGRSGFGIIIAQDLADAVRQDVTNSEHPIVAYEVTKTDDGVKMFEMARSKSAGG